MSKPRTIFCDVDGVLLKHHGAGPSEQWCGAQAVLPGARDWLDKMEMDGTHIVLVTARPESQRKYLEEALQSLRLVYHQLVMGVTSGERVLINDQKRSGRSAIAHEVPRNCDMLKFWEKCHETYGSTAVRRAQHEVTQQVPAAAALRVENNL